MNEFWGFRLAGVALLLGLLAVTIPQLPTQSLSAEFLIYLFFWPILFFTAGFVERMPWAVVAASALLSVYWYLDGPSATHWIATIAAGMLAVMWALDRALDSVLSETAYIKFAKILAGKPGNAILTISVGGVMFVYGIGLDGFASGEPAILACGALYFLAATVLRRRVDFASEAGVRKRFNLRFLFLLALLLAGAHNRLSVRTTAFTPIEGWRRALYFGTYASLGWRWCYGWYEWALGATAKGAR